MFRIFAYLHRHPDSGIFYFRLTVPAHLRHTIGKTEIKKSLHTGLRAEAIFKAQQLYVETRKLFLKAEARMTPQQKKPADILADLESVQSSPDGSIQKITIQVNGQGVTIEHDDPKQERETAKQLLGHSAAPASKGKTAKPPPKETSPLLSKMIKAYFAEVKLTGTQQPKTVEENQAIFQLLQEVLKNPAASTIGFKLATDFKNTVLRLPPNRTKGKFAGKSVAEILRMRPADTMSIANVNKYLRRVSALFEWGKRHGHVHENPFSGLGIRKDTSAHKLRDRFTIEELQRLFAPNSLHPDMRESYMYWLPWLGLYTGARLGELCQLHLADIRQEADIWVFDINKKDEKRLKTLASERLVPIHPKLMELGLLERVEGLRQRGEKRLFPELKLRRDGYGQTASKWFGRHRVKMGIEKPFHSLRHTFADELKQRGADFKKVVALIGHTEESMTFGQYGKEYDPDVLYPVVCLLDFKLI